VDNWLAVLILAALIMRPGVAGLLLWLWLWWMITTK
jgi:hypothetical protein